MSEGPGTGSLRDRRRVQTATDIHAAALACVLADGLGATTVARIAERAGVSTRTFFRYFTSKEAAILPGHSALRDLLGELQDAPSGQGVPRLIAALTQVMEQDAGARDDHRQITGLLEAEPALRAHVASEDAELARAVTVQLQASDPSADPDQLRLVTELALAAWRSSWTIWGRGGSPAQSLVDVWQTRRAALLEAAGTLN